MEEPLPGYHIKFTGHFDIQMYGSSLLLSTAFHAKLDFETTVIPSELSHPLLRHPMFSSPLSQFVKSLKQIR